MLDDAEFGKQRLQGRDLAGFVDMREHQGGVRGQS